MLRYSIKLAQFTSKIAVILIRVFIVLELLTRIFLIGWDSVNDRISTISKSNLIFVMRLLGAKIGKDCDIESGIRFHNAKGYQKLTIGTNCHIGKDCFFDLRDEVVIENNVVISMQCTFITHIDMSKSELSSKYKSSSDKIVIGNNVYIGVQSTILKGVNLSSNVVIGAMSLVNKSVSEGEVVLGVPAKVIA